MPTIGEKILKALMEEVLAVYQKPEKIYKVFVEEDKAITEYDIQENTMTMRFPNGMWAKIFFDGEDDEEVSLGEVLSAWDRYLRKSKKIQVFYMDILGQERIVEIEPERLLPLLSLLKNSQVIEKLDRGINHEA
jgi:hypothetical protein